MMGPKETVDQSVMREPEQVKDYWAIERVLSLEDLDGHHDLYRNSAQDCKGHLKKVKQEYREKAINKVFDRINVDDTATAGFVLFDPVTHMSKFVPLPANGQMTRRDKENTARQDLAIQVVDRVVGKDE